MANIAHVELSDTFNRQRETINQLIDMMNTGGGFVPGEGVERDPSGAISIKISGDGLSFDGNGNLIGNDAYPNLMTQVVLDPDVEVPVPTVTSDTTISFPAFKVIFDNKVYYGKKISDFDVLEIPPTIMTVESGEDGAIFVYVDNAGEIHQSLNSVSPSNSSTQCLLGSYFRLGNKIQTNSWAYTPWNGSTSKERRFTTGASVGGGLIETIGTQTLSRSAMNVILEGINAKNSVYVPNKISFDGESPYSTKKIWPGYDASVSDTTVLDTTHIYNITDKTVDDISNIEGYIVLVPGIVAPTGQDVYLMAMSNKEDRYKATEWKNPYSGYVDKSTLGSFIYVGDRYIGITKYGGITISEDGINWSNPVNNLPNEENTYIWDSNLIYTNNHFLVTASEDGYIARYYYQEGSFSPSIPWTARKYAENWVNRHNLSYVNGKLVMTGHSSTDTSHSYILVSNNNGETWTQSEITGSLEYAVHFIYSGNKYIAITLSGWIYSSDDLETWTQEPDDPNLKTRNVITWNSISFDGSKYIIFGNKELNDGGYYSTSLDGLTWTEVKQIINPKYVTEQLYTNNTLYGLSSGKLAKLLPASYDQIFDSIDEAINAIYGLTFDLGNVASRVSWLNQSIAVKIGATNFTDKNQLQIVGQIPNSLGIYSSESSGGSGSRVSGITVKANGVVIGEEDKKTVINFASGFTGLNTSENEVSISANASAASQAEVDAGTESVKYVTPATLKNADFLLTTESLGKITQSITMSEWPSVTSVESWPHTIIITVNNNYTLPTVLPEYTDKVLTWEVVIKNVNSSSIALTWPSAYQAFNNENLPAYVAPNTSVFFMMRKYSNNFTLVSTQGTQSNTIL